MPHPDTAALLARIAALEQENAMLRRDFSNLQRAGDAVKVPAPFKPLFDAAQETVHEYFRHLKMDPAKGTIEINDQRYVLVRASTLSKDFLDTIQNLYADRGEAEALAIGKNFLFDIAHVIGMNDARNFHAKMNLTDPIAKLSAGPVHFAYSGWAFVDILPESNPTPDENFYLIYNHPYSFEADSWIRSGKQASTAVCIMNSGYSSGWCEESFGIPLTAVEVSCTAKGDDQCLFIMAPPHKIPEHLAHFHTHHKNKYTEKAQYEVPTFFERKRVEEELQRSRKLAEESAKSKADFVANMSHELRTPLGAILGFTDLLAKTTLDATQQDYLLAISNSGSNLLSIINDILDLSKLDAGKFMIEAVPFSIPELMHSLQVMFSSRAHKKGLEFTCTADAAVHHAVIGDPMRLTQILVNLIGNAIKFTESGGVYVQCSVVEEAGEQVQLGFTIRDTGIGIPAEKTGFIFERFMQADTNITRRYGGTGLGLAITKQLVELQGGIITVQSREGDGATFHFVLPYTKTSGNYPSPVNKALLQQLQMDTVQNILLVEDNLMNQKLTTIILENNGFLVTLAENGKIALDILKDRSFDLVLMDIQMPEMDGYRATQLIREKLKISTPVIAMTAHALPGEREKCIQLGMNDYLPKPFTETDLLHTIAKWAPEEKAALQEAAPVAGPVTDLSFLQEQTKNNQAFMQEMIGVFCTQTPQHLQNLQQAIDARDYAAIYKTVHTLRNTTGFFGLTPHIGDALLAMERHALQAAGMAMIEPLFEEVKIVFEKALAELGAD